MKDTAQILQRLGFGDYEARAYTALLQRSPMTGYEIAKLSRIPRANVYDILPRSGRAWRRGAGRLPFAAKYCSRAPFRAYAPAGRQVQ